LRPTPPASFGPRWRSPGGSDPESDGDELIPLTPNEIRRLLAHLVLWQSGAAFSLPVRTA
jgi:hypothetical protein